MAFLTGQIWYCKSGGWTAVTAWAATTSVAAGVLNRQLATPTVGNERVFASIVAGTTGSSEPTWLITQGAITVADGTVTWIEITGKPGVNGDTTNSPAWLAVKNTAVSTGVIIFDSVTSSLQVCSTAGTTGNGSAPSFSATAGVTTTDNSATWTSLGLASGFAAWGAPWARLNLGMATGAFMLNNDLCYISNNHAETQSTTMNYNATIGTTNNANRYLCVSDTAAPPTALATTGSVSSTGASSIFMGQQSAQYIYGLNFSAGSAANSASVVANSANMKFDTCNFALTNTNVNSTLGFVGDGGFSGINAAFDQNLMNLVNCNLVFGNVSQTIASAAFSMKGGSIAATGSVPNNLFAINTNFPAPVYAHLRDVNLSAFTHNLLLFSDIIGGQILIENSSIGSGYTLASGTPFYTSGQNPSISIQNVDSTGTVYNFGHKNQLGSTVTETTIVRTGGAVDFTTPVSLKMVSNANPTSTYPYTTGIPIFAVNTFTSGTHTATIFLTTNATLDNSKMWIEVECLGSAGSPLGAITSTQAGFFATPTALTADGSSVWGGGALTNIYKIPCNYSPALAGPLFIRIYLAAPSATVYVDYFPTLA